MQHVREFSSKKINTILLPTRPQVDTLVSLFILKQYGDAMFPGVSGASVSFNGQDVEDKDWSSQLAKGVLLFDMGNGPLDHHAQDSQMCLAQLVTKCLGQENNKTLKKLIEFARRDDVDGQGTLSEDPIDRAFGLSGLVVALNRMYPEEPHRVYEMVMPLLEAHHKEQVKRIEVLPKLFDEMLAQGTAQKTSVIYRGKKITVALFSSDEPSLASHLRSFVGGNFDVVVQIRSTGHVNILTHTNRRSDLRSLAVIIRKSELMVRGSADVVSADTLSAPGRLDAVPQWYFDLATNSLQNGGVNPGNIEPTKIPQSKLLDLVRIGLEESMWKPQD